MSRRAILNGLTSYPLQASSTAANQPEVSVVEQEQLHRFVENMTTARAEVIRCKPETVAEQFSQLLQDRHIGHLCVGQIEEIQTYIGDLPEGIRLTVFDQSIESLRSELFSSIDAGLTSCAAALSDTGTLVLYSDIRQPRLLSLVPPVHIAILFKQQMFADLGSWLHSVDAAEIPTNMILISGPSKSADIEQVLAYGVHGPRQLLVLLVE